jgi:hypothetical protein
LLVAWIAGWPDPDGWSFRIERDLDDTLAIRCQRVAHTHVWSSVDAFEQAKLRDIFDFDCVIARRAKDRYDAFIEAEMTVLRKDGR